MGTSDSICAFPFHSYQYFKFSNLRLEITQISNIKTPFPETAAKELETHVTLPLASSFISWLAFFHETGGAIPPGEGYQMACSLYRM